MSERRIFTRAEYDPAKLLTYTALLFVGVLIVFVSTIIGVQIWETGEANTESWAALTGLIGWATSQVSIIFSNRFGTTEQSAKKDEVIARQASTAAVIANAAGAMGAVTPGPLNPETGNVPAAEAVQSQEKQDETTRP